MKLRHAIAAAAAAITMGCSVTAALPSTAGADVPAPTPAVTAFWQFMHDLQQYPYSCTAYHVNIIGNGEGGGVANVVETPVYEGTCLQAFLLVLQYDATFYTVNTNGNPDA